MATLERPQAGVSASLAGEASGPSTLDAAVPAAFPQDELIQIRHDYQAPSEDPPVDSHHLPPSYDDDEDPFVDAHHPHAHHPSQHSRNLSSSVPPTYPHEERPSFDNQSGSAAYPQEKPSRSHEAESSSTAEKRRLDLDSVTAAISRLYEVAPQLGDQRVELNAQKRDEMELARMVGRGRMTDQQAADKGKHAETSKEAELAHIWRSIEHAHGQRLNGQEAAMQPSTSASASKERDSRKQAFMEDLVARSGAGRMHGQDCTPSSPLAGPSTASGAYVGERQDLITVGQFFKEHAKASPASSTSPSSADASSTPPLVSPTSSGKRSSFVPAFVGSIGRRASLKPAASQDSLPDAGSSRTKPIDLNSAVDRSDGRVQHGFIAEWQESIRVIQVHLDLDLAPGSLLDLVVADEGATKVWVSSSKDGWRTVVPLPGPAAAFTGKATTSPAGANGPNSTASFRLSSSPVLPGTDSALSSEPPLSAPELAALAPAWLGCVTCGATIVDTSSAVRSRSFKDLPSEHWEEFVGSWLCHDEMKLALGASDGDNSPGTAQGSGSAFWPKGDEVLVGANYVLVQGSLMVGEEGASSQSWKVRAGAETETWQPIECSACSSPLGRRMQHPSVPPTSTFKLAKYAFRPLSASRQPLASLPLSVFITADLLELADVHRCYHFVVYAEEDPTTPPVLIWLLNPSIHITLSSPNVTRPTPFRASKLMFSTSPLPARLPPAFDAAEPLHYPASICRQLAAELKASHAAYPGSSAGGMMGLKGGWLERY